MVTRRIETKASRTAAYNCFSRACATREIGPLRKFLMRKMFPTGIYEYVCARTKVIDAAFLAALEDGFAQIVLLGAGFDTRALRFTERNHGTKVFELEAPTTQEPKLRIIHKKRLKIPPELIFASIDFDREDIFDVLTRAGYYDGQKTLFLWEDVCMYLTAQAVDDTLAFVQKHAARGSRIVFDYIYASVLRRENRYYGEKGIFDMVAKTGESWTFGLEEGKVEPFLVARGFEMLAHYTPAELEKLYLAAVDGTMHGRVNGTHCIVLAEAK
jgi:methyltransferase (TIGR00027 family)